MNYRSFRETSVSEIGLGTWQLGSSDWGAVGEAEAFAILDRFVADGGNFIDTADVYGSGQSERVLGAYLRQTKNTLHIATKLGRRQDGTCGWPQNFTYDAMKAHVEASLRNLGISRLFLEQLHCIPTTALKEGKVFDNLRSLQAEGLVEHWGVSVETAEEALLCLEQEGLASLQVIFNLFRQHVADEVFEKAAQKGVAIIVRVPLASGLLSGKFGEGHRFAATDHRNYNANGESFNAGETFSGIEFSRGVELSRAIGALLPDARMAPWALRWILDHPQVTTVIPGATRPEQVESNLSASALPALTPSTHAQLRALYDQEIRPFIRGQY